MTPGYSHLDHCEYLGDFRLHCVFQDRIEGILDLSGYRQRGGVFGKLLDESYARRFCVVNGVLTWGAGVLDIAPETVYHLATNTPLPSWMNPSA